MTLCIHNPTIHPRKEVVLFGAPEGVGCPIKQRQFRRYGWQTAEVLAEAECDGEVTGWSAQPVEPVDFDYPEIYIDHDENRLEQKWLIANEQMEIIEWRGLRDDQVVYVWTYRALNQKSFRWEMLTNFTFLDEPSAVSRISTIFSPRPGYRDHTYESQRYAYEDFRDKSSVIVEGCYVHTDWDNMDVMDISTSKAMLEAPMTAFGRKGSIGHWNVGPYGMHPDRVMMPNYSWDQHIGMISNKRPADTGDQAFKVWANFDAHATGRASLIWQSKQACKQEALRPMYVYEEDGSFPMPRKDTFSSWDEQSHEASGSTHHFGRKQGGWPHYDGWTPMDDQHYEVTAICETQMVSPSAAVEHLLRHKAYHICHKRNIPNEGRALRLLHGAINILRAIDDQFLKEFVVAWAFKIRDAAMVKNRAPYDNFVLRTYDDDTHTGFKLEHITWEDGIAVYCIDAAVLYLSQEGFDPQAGALKMVNIFLSKSLTHHAFRKEDSQTTKAIEWVGPNKYGSKRIMADGTNYRFWMIPCLSIALRYAMESGDSDTITAASDHLAKIGAGSYFNKDAYMGALGL